jgi:hypothetical protein
MKKHFSFAALCLAGFAAFADNPQNATPPPRPVIVTPPLPTANGGVAAVQPDTAGVDVAALTPAPTSPGGKIQFEMPVFDFGKVSAGEAVKYSFIFTNTGDDVLEVTHVQPGCGCTSAGDWTHKVDPGKTGVIPIQFNSGNFNGPVVKTVTVTSSDKEHASTMLQIKGTIWRPIEVTPQFAVLNISPDAQTATTTVKIVNNIDTPLTLFPPESNNKNFSVDLKTNQVGKEFELTVSATGPMQAGNVQGQITMRSSSTNMPLISVTAWANVQPAIIVMPPQIMLPQAPLASAITPSITIQNNSTNLLKLSDPVVNQQGVDVQLKETQPGRIFMASLTFQPGFEAPVGQPLELTIKSSNPSMPVIKVPVNQTPRANVPPQVKLPPAPNAAAAPTTPPPVPVPVAPHAASAH